jgi:hypothetical protein
MVLNQSSIWAMPIRFPIMSGFVGGFPHGGFAPSWAQVVFLLAAVLGKHHFFPQAMIHITMQLG